MTRLDEIDRILKSRELAYERSVGEAVAVLKERSLAMDDERDLRQRSEALARAIEVLNSYADERQDELQRKVETLVTHGLQTIFGPELSFHVNTGTKGKLTATTFVVRSQVDGSSIDTPVMDARGGGVAAVIGFLLRLVILLLHPGVRPTLFLDESFSHLSADYEPALAQFIKELCERTGVQIVLVTHSYAFDDAADMAYRFSLDEAGVTKVLSSEPR